MEADEEWSDGSDDALRSGSATDIAPSDGEELNNEEKKMAATNRLLKSDPVNAILDKIDAELGAMNSKPVQPKSSPKSYPKEKSKSEDSQQNKKSLSESKLNSKEAKMKDGDYCPSDLDSVAAEQIDEKFKEIMKKKRGGFLEDLNKQQSDNETIRTEDFESKFKSALIHNKDRDDMNQVKSSRIQQQKTLPAPPPSRKNYYASDLESVQTEDFESKFSDLMIKDPIGKSSIQPIRSQTPGLPSASANKPSILLPQQPETLDRQLTEKKSSERKIQFLENGHVHSPLDPVLKKSESQPRRMLSDYGRNTPTPAVPSIPNNGHKPNSNFYGHTSKISVNGHTLNTSVNGHSPNATVNWLSPNTSVNGHSPNTSVNGHSPNTSVNGLTHKMLMGDKSSSNGALQNSFSASPTINGDLSAANGTIPAFSRSLPVTRFNVENENHSRFNVENENHSRFNVENENHSRYNMENVNISMKIILDLMWRM
ncbi:hypothetical protein LOTGIDRAFT_171040 [Lottia gigantea]|uniref:Uncharacterized protein n=1 Tax=Lottia gigantea TaxID=225164 RepID=V4B9Q4_LOTGI|nr:hypothetical protein LOTGIDRAFT_171040 [Lottia gigantea]ESP04201.1 hypothetical protein LOTGIDRAFT_171040 [Lottia gigantea]